MSSWTEHGPEAVRLVDGSIIEAGWGVLCAGTHGSPPILMQSGIGPHEHLRSLGIPVRVDLSGVGTNLADHPGVELEPDFRDTVREAPILHWVATFHSPAAPSDGPPDLMLWASDPVGDPPTFSIEAGLLKPRSRGTVRLRSADPADPPRIELPSLTDAMDVERLTEGYARAWEVLSWPEVRRLCGDLPPEIAERLSERTASLL